MLKLLKTAVTLLALAACAPGADAAPQERDAGLAFFNSFFFVPEEKMAASCVIDARMSVVSEKKFFAILDRIIDDTDAGIMYSDPTKRDRVVYVVPVDCDKFDEKNTYSATRYFENVASVAKVRANENPYILSTSDDRMKSAEAQWKNIRADLEGAAFAAEFEVIPLSIKENSQLPALHCVINAGQRMQLRYGLPILFIGAGGDSNKGHSIPYIYNSHSAGAELAHYLTKRGLKECKAKYNFEVRKLNDAELADMSKIFVEYK